MTQTIYEVTGGQQALLNLAHAWHARYKPSDPRGLAPRSTALWARVLRTTFTIYSRTVVSTRTRRTCSCMLRTCSLLTTGCNAISGSVRSKRNSRSFSSCSLVSVRVGT